MNNTIKIITLIITFLAFAAVGYLLPINKGMEPLNPEPQMPLQVQIIEDKAEISRLHFEIESQGADSVKWVCVESMTPVSEKDLWENGASVPANQRVPVSTILELSSGCEYTIHVGAIQGNQMKRTSLKMKTLEGIEYVQGDSRPKLSSISVEPRTKDNVDKPGLNVTAKGTVETSDTLEYQLYLSGNTTPIMRNRTGSFVNVPPSDKKYKMRSVNLRTEEYDEREFSAPKTKIKKLSAEELDEMMKKEARPADFYHYFETELEIKTNKGTYSTLHEINKAIAENEWPYNVTNVWHNADNRIYSFEVQIVE